MATVGNQITRTEFSTDTVVAQYLYDGLGNTTFSKYAYVSAPCFEVEFRYAPKSSGYSHSATATIQYYNYTNNTWVTAATFSFSSGTWTGTVQIGSFRHNCNRPSDWSEPDQQYNDSSKNHLWRITYIGDVGSRAESWLRIFIRGLQSSLVPTAIYTNYFQNQKIACCKNRTANDFAYVRDTDDHQTAALDQFKRTNFTGNIIQISDVNSLISI